MQTAPVVESTCDHSDLINSDLIHSIPDGLTEPREISVLVIEDDSTDFRIAGKTLQLMDTFRANTSHAPDLVTARGMIAERDFDVALVDFCLGMDTGTRALQELGGRIGSTALILLTGMPGQDIRQIALKAGAIHCIDKNQLNPVLLETTIRSALHTHALEAKLQEMIVELELANRAKTDFFARIGHDLKTPLNVILGYAQMIKAPPIEPEVQEKSDEFADNICNAGAHLLEVLDNLILHAASQGSYAGNQFEAADLNDLANQAVEMTHVLARSREHTVDVAFCDDSVIVNCQPAVLTQAILNVISNAVKYTPPGGHIHISLANSGRFNEIRVEDSGIGMSRDDIDIALRPFGRVKLPGQHSQDGTGIGLPIVRDIVSSHGGQLDLESTPGEGTIVTLRFPTVNAATGDA